MENGHKDLLSLDDLPYHRDEVARRVGQFVLVDHPRVSLLSMRSTITDSFCSSIPLVRHLLVSQHIADAARLMRTDGKHGAEKVTGLIDHHRDEGSYPNANPRVVKMVASCSTLTANILLQAGSVQNLPTELVDLLLSVIALDSKAFSKGASTFPSVFK